VRVAVIGAGEMGRWLANFSRRFAEVTVSDSNQAKARRVAAELKVAARPAERAAAEADLIFVAVPIARTPGVLLRLAKVAPRGALLVDVASVKGEVVKSMEKIKEDVELVSIHPLFGPGATSLRNKDVVVIPVRPGARYQEFRKILERSGARITEMSADLHDQAMAVIQCLSHFVLLAYLQTLRSLDGVKLSRGLRTPIFSSLAELAKAAAAGKPELYGELQRQNKYSRLVRCSLVEAIHSLDVAFARGDYKAVRAIVAWAAAQFGRDQVKRAYEELYRRFERERS